MPRSTGVISMLTAPLRLTLSSSAKSTSASRSWSSASASSASCLVGLVGDRRHRRRIEQHEAGGGIVAGLGQQRAVVAHGLGGDDAAQWRERPLADHAEDVVAEVAGRIDPHQVEFLVVGEPCRAPAHRTHQHGPGDDRHGGDADIVAVRQLQLDQADADEVLAALVERHAGGGHCGKAGIGDGRALAACDDDLGQCVGWWRKPVAQAVVLLIAGQRRRLLLGIQALPGCGDLPGFFGSLGLGFACLGFSLFAIPCLGLGLLSAFAAALAALASASAFALAALPPPSLWLRQPCVPAQRHG